MHISFSAFVSLPQNRLPRLNIQIQSRIFPVLLFGCQNIEILQFC